MEKRLASRRGPREIAFKMTITYDRERMQLFSGSGLLGSGRSPSCGPQGCRASLTFLRSGWKFLPNPPGRTGFFKKNKIL